MNNINETIDESFELWFNAYISSEYQALKANMRKAYKAGALQGQLIYHKRIVSELTERK